MPNFGFGTGAEARYPAVHQQIIENAYDVEVYRRLLIQRTQPDNDLFQFETEGGVITATVPEVGEGQEIKIEQLTLDATVVQAVEIGTGFGVTKNELLFNRIDTTAYKPREAGLRIGYTVDAFCSGLINGAVPAGNVITATGSTVMNDGTTLTIAGSIGINDLNRAIRLLRENRVQATDIILNPIGMEFLENLPQFKAVNLWGERGYYLGAVGQILGMRVHVTTVQPVGTAIVMAVTDKSFSNQYIPTGFFCLVHDIITESRYNPSRRQDEIYATMYYTAVISRAQNIARIDYSGGPY